MDISKTILMMHGTISGAQSVKGTEFEMFDRDIIDYELVRGFKAVFAGHLHEFQHFETVWYPGSIERLTFDDENLQKFFLDVTVDKGVVSVQPVPLHAREMMTLDYSQVGKASTKGAIVRVQNVPRDAVKDVIHTLKQQECFFLAGIHLLKGIEQKEAPSSQGATIERFVRDYAAKTEINYKGDIDAAERTIVELVNSQP